MGIVDAYHGEPTVRDAVSRRRHHYKAIVQLFRASSLFDWFRSASEAFMFHRRAAVPACARVPLIAEPGRKSKRFGRRNDSIAAASVVR